MSNFIPNLLRKKPEPAVEELRKVVAENQKEKQFLIGLREKATAIRKAVIDTQQKAADEASEATVNAFIKARDEVRLADIYGDAASNIVATLQRRNDTRTRPALVAALNAVNGRLKTEEAEVAKLDARSAEHLDIAATEAVSPARQRIKDAIREAEAYLSHLNQTPPMSVPQFVHPIRFILGNEYCQ